jgi:hypothetical protein
MVVGVVVVVVMFGGCVCQKMLKKWSLRLAFQYRVVDVIRAELECVTGCVDSVVIVFACVRIVVWKQ